MRRVVEIFWKFTRDTGHQHPQLPDSNNSYGSLLLKMGYSMEQARTKLNEIANMYGLSLPM